MWFLIERKAAHVAEFFVLTWLALRLAKKIGWKIKTAYLATFLFSLAYAASDEIHQTFVDRREGKLSDVLIDVIGIVAALIIFYRLERGSKKIK